MDFITDEAQLGQHRQEVILEYLRQRMEDESGRRAADAFIRDVEAAEISAIKARNTAALLQEMAREPNYHAPNDNPLTDAEIEASVRSFLTADIEEAHERHRSHHEADAEEACKLQFLANVEAALERQDPDVVAGVEAMVQRLYRESPHRTPSYEMLQDALWEHYSELDWVSFLPESLSL